MIKEMIHKKHTRIFNVNNNQFEQTIEAASQIIKDAGTVAFPTETVYGLGANALDPVAVNKIFRAKGRPADNPLIVHIATKKQLFEIAKNIPTEALDLIDTFWPGPLTIILNRRRCVPNITTGGLDTVAVRMPSNRIAIELIKRANTPIAAPSANISGRPSPTNAQHVIADMEGKIDAIIDGGSVEIGIESTVLDLTSIKPTILRPGEIGIADLKEHMKDIVIGYTDNQTDRADKVKSPGMKYTHYSPKAKLILIESKSNDRSISQEIEKLYSEMNDCGIKIGLLLTEENAKFILDGKMPEYIFSLGKKMSLSRLQEIYSWVLGILIIMMLILS